MMGHVYGAWLVARKPVSGCAGCAVSVCWDCMCVNRQNPLPLARTLPLEHGLQQITIPVDIILADISHGSDSCLCRVRMRACVVNGRSRGDPALQHGRPQI